MAPRGDLDHHDGCEHDVNDSRNNDDVHTVDDERRAGTLVPQTPTQSEFLSPSHNISCEIDDSVRPSSITSTFCLTLSPARSVTLKLDSTLTECTGPAVSVECGHRNAHAAVRPVHQLSAPSPVRLRPRASSAHSGNGDGFVIATSGVTPLGNAKLSTG